MPFYMKAFLAGLGGFAGGFVGNPADLVNVRMQNDMKLPPDQRRKLVFFITNFPIIAIFVFTYSF